MDRFIFFMLVFLTLVIFTHFNFWTSNQRFHLTWMFLETIKFRVDKLFLTFHSWTNFVTHLLHLTIRIDRRFSPWKLGCPIMFQSSLTSTFFSLKLFGVSKKVTSTNTLCTSSNNPIIRINRCIITRHTICEVP